MDDYKIAEFNLSFENFNNFKRLVQHPNDCVINAMELIGLIDSENADIMRIITPPGGLFLTQILGIFDYKTETKFDWTFAGTKNGQEFIDGVKTIGNNMMIFCGATLKDFQHVFLIAKDNEGTIAVVDPQYANTVVPFKDYFLEVLKSASMFYFLQFKPKNFQ
jgi:hypothetical protein